MAVNLGWVLRHANLFALWHPEVLALAVTLGVLYWQAVGPRRAQLAPGAPPPGAGRAAAFAGSLLTFYVAIGTPLNLLADTYLFSAHMLQEMLLAMVWPPLVIAGLPPWLWERLLAGGALARLWRVMTTEPIPLFAFNGLFLIMQLPGVLDASLRLNWLYALLQYVLMATALFLWWPLISPVAQPGRLSRGAQFLYLFFAMDFMMPAVIYVFFTGFPFYPVYAARPRVFGLTPVADQQIGAVLMFAAMLAAYGAVAAARLSEYLGGESQFYA